MENQNMSHKEEINAFHLIDDKADLT